MPVKSRSTSRGGLVALLAALLSTATPTLGTAAAAEPPAPGPDLDARAVQTIEAGDLGLSRPVDLAYDDTRRVFFVVGGGDPAPVRAVGPRWETGTPVDDPGVLVGQDFGRSRAGGPLSAIGPEDGLEYRLDVPTGTLTVRQPGQSIVARFDVSDTGLVSPEAITFAPSSDITDGSALHLFVVDSGDERWEGGITELTLVQAVAAAPTIDTATLVQSVDTSQWNPPSTDPSGIVWNPTRAEFIVVDSEVNETALFDDVNLWRITGAGAVLSTGATYGPRSAGSYSDEPTGVGLDVATNTMFITDDTGTNTVYVVDSGSDEVLGNSNDVVVTEVDVEAVASDPEDPTFHPGEGVLYFLSGIDLEIHRLDPVDGVFGNGDDIRTNFDISHLGPTDFEGLAVAPVRGTLYVASRNQDQIFEITTSGDLLRRIDVPFSGFTFISGLAVAPSSADPSTPNLWFVDRAADEVNDGKVIEISVPGVDDPATTNGAPVAVDDTASTTEDTAVLLDVVANDTDPDGDQLTPVNVSDPANGSAAVAPDRTITYTPDPGFTGTDTFTYRASDGTLVSNVATVTVDVTEALPLEQFAVSEETVFGTKSGNIGDTRLADDVYEVLTEEHTGGPPRQRISRLDHRWTFEISGGDSVTFTVEARRSANSEGDDFEFSSSTDGGVTFDPLVVVVSSTTDAVYTAALPPDTSGTVIVRAVDQDRTSGRGNVDSLFIDRMVISTENPRAPLPTVWIETSDPSAGEPRDPGQFTISRSPSVGSLVVDYSVAGSATEGVDYESIPGFVTLLDGQSSTTVSIIPIDDGLVEGAESVVLTLVSRPGSYRVGVPFEAGLELADDETTTASFDAIAQSTDQGTTVSGDLSSTFADDGIALEVREEAYAGGKRSRLQHRWTFDIGSGGSATFFLQAYHSGTEDFVFAMSTDNGASWTDMVTVVGTSDDGTHQQYALPAGVSGTIQVRVLDVDRSRLEPVLDSIFVDDMYIEVG